VDAIVTNLPPESPDPGCRRIVIKSDSWALDPANMQWTVDALREDLMSVHGLDVTINRKGVWLQPPRPRVDTASFR